MSNLFNQREFYRTSIRQSKMVSLISPSQYLCIPCSSPYSFKFGCPHVKTVKLWKNQLKDDALESFIKQEWLWMWRWGCSSKASVWDCVVLSTERFHCGCVCSAKNILASGKRKHTMRESWKQACEQPAQFHTAHFWQPFNSFCCFSRKHISVCDVTRFSEGGSQNKLDWQCAAACQPLGTWCYYTKDV